MKKLIIYAVLCIIAFSYNVEAQNYKYPMGGSNTADTLVSNTADTTLIFNLWYSTTTRKPGRPCFEVYTTVLHSPTTHDSLEIELWVTSRSISNTNAGKDDNGWMYLCTYNSWEQADPEEDGALSNDADFIIVADTLNYISSLYAHLILKYVGGEAGDSTVYIIYYNSDRGKE